MRPRWILLTLAALAAPAHAAAQTTAQTPLPVFPELGYAELEAEEMGFEYRNVLRDAWDIEYDGSEQALSDLFGMAVSFEGRAAQAHARVLGALMFERGDERFAERLAREPATVRRAVFSAMLGVPHGAPRDFPRTFALRDRPGGGE